MKVVGLLFLLLASACNSIDVASKLVDKTSFNLLGITLLSQPEEISLSEIHLATDRLKGHLVIVEGQLEYVGEHSTHLILADKSARMLVLLTKLTDPLSLKAVDDKVIRIYGAVKIGQRGLPVVEALSVSEVPSST